MACEGGIAPCTGFESGSCSREPIFDAGISNITLQSLDAAVDYLQLTWSNGVGDVRFIIIERLYNIINDSKQVAHDSAQPLFIGQALDIARDYTIFYRCELNGLCSVWGLQRFVFVGTLINQIVDGIDYIIDGIVPDYIVS